MDIGILDNKLIYLIVAGIVGANVKKWFDHWIPDMKVHSEKIVKWFKAAWFGSLIVYFIFRLLYLTFQEIPLTQSYVIRMVFYAFGLVTTLLVLTFTHFIKAFESLGIMVLKNKLEYIEYLKKSEENSMSEFRKTIELQRKIDELESRLSKMESNGK